MYVTIPDITESEELLSLSAEADGVTFSAVIGLGDTALRLMRASENGEQVPLVVLAADPQMMALDSVYVTAVSLSQGGDPPVAHITFLAQAVRLV